MMLFAFTQLKSQCNNFVNVSLNQAGEATIFAESLMENSQSYENAMASLDNENFANSVMFDCDDIGEEITVYITYEDNGNPSSCESMVTIEDKLFPIAIVTSSFEIDLNDENDTYTLLPEDINENSWDNCGDVDLSLSQELFTSAHVGQNTVVMTVTDGSGNSAQAWTTVTVTIGGQGSTIDCVSNTEDVSPWGISEVFAIDFIENPDDYTSVLISTDPVNDYASSLMVDCSESTDQGTTIYVRAYQGNTYESCNTTLILNDNVPPVAISVVEITAQLSNGSVTIFPSDIDNGSYDHCGTISMTLSQSVFTAADLGENTVSLTVMDESGNTNLVWSTVIIVDAEPCSLSSVIYPSDITVFDEDGTADDLTVENLQTIHGYTFEEVHAYTEETCDNLAFTYTDLVLDGTSLIKILRTWTSLDWLTGELEESNQIVKLYYEENTSLSCNADLVINVENGVVQLTAMDILAGSGYNFDNLTLEITDAAGNIIADNTITPNYIGMSLVATVTSTTTGNTCWTTIEVTNEGASGCPLTEEFIIFPVAEISIANTGVSSELILPEYIASNFDYTLQEVQPTITSDCAIAAFAYQDEVFEYADGNFKIIREFTIIDWLTYNPGSTEGIWTFVQTINVGVNPTDFICDTEPNSAPVGDCDSGHSLEDDVEWPSDLSIADYRISPEELVSFSGVANENVQPIFFNEPDVYSASYSDEVLSLTQTTLTISRNWVATREAYGFSWSYSQVIVIDFSEFDNLISVTTGTNRAVPGVMFNEAISTNEYGTCLLEDAISDIELNDTPRNGVNILDIILVQRHILGMGELPDVSILAADCDDDDNVSATDLLLMRKIILGTVTENDWRFVENTFTSITPIAPKAAYLAVKPGDVDDNAVLNGTDNPEADALFEMEDVLLNAGENYSVPVYLDQEMAVYGLEIRMDINTNLISNLEIEEDLEFVGIDYLINDENELVVLLSNFAETSYLDDNTPIMTLNFTAMENGILHDGLQVEDKTSYGVDEESKLFVIGGELGNQIGTGTNSPELSALKAFPNPTSDYLNIDISRIGVSGDMKIELFSITGQKLLQTTSNRVDVSDFENGMYYYRVTIGEYQATNKFMVVK